MNRISLRLAPIWSVIFCLPLVALGESADSIDRHSIGPFLKNYCIDCHGPKRQRADFRVDTVEWEIKDDVAAQTWQDILDVLNSGDMPPEDEPQPSSREFDKIVGVLTNDLKTARTRLVETGGVNTIRRINKREYINTIKHLFGINIDESVVPEDFRGEHFDTTGGQQYFDGPLLEQYIRLGTQVAEKGLEWSGKPYANVETSRHEAEIMMRKKEMNISGPKSETGFYLYSRHREQRDIAVSLGKDPRASYRIRIQGGVVDATAPERSFLIAEKISTIRGQRNKPAGIIQIGGTPDQPGIAEIVIETDALNVAAKQTVGFTEALPGGITNPSRWYPIYLDQIEAQSDLPSVWIDWLEVEGPIYPSDHNVFGELISKTGRNLNSRKKLDELLTAFAFEAFRRVTPDEGYINKLVVYAEARMESGLSYEEAVSETIGLILASPAFLYLEEHQFNDSRHLSERAFAVRLAYFLWSAPPDEELYEVAEAGNLFKPVHLREQVNRLLDDPRAASFYEGFMSQWADLERLDQISVDWKKFPSFSRGVRHSIYREPIEFFKVLVEKNLNVGELIDSRFSVVNSALANYYGINSPSPRSSQSTFEPVALPANSPRGGFITQSAFLTIGSAGDRSSPVVRGAMILERLLNNPPPPPPPNVPEIGTLAETPVTNRELVELHREQATCFACHKKIDPIGFGLENFDSVGLWRDVELVDGKEVPIDAGGVLVSGARFNNLGELQKLLLTQKAKLARNLIENMTAYGIGRPIEFSDAENIDAVVEWSQSVDYGMRDLIYLVVNSRSFRTK